MPIFKVQVEDGKIIKLGEKFDSLISIQQILTERFSELFKYGLQLFFRDKQVKDLGQIIKVAQQQNLQSVKLKAQPIIFNGTLSVLLQSSNEKTNNKDQIVIGLEKEGIKSDTVQLTDLQYSQQNISENQLKQSSISIVFSGFKKQPVKPKQDSVYQQFDLNISQIQRGKASQMYSSIDNSLKNNDSQQCFDIQKQRSMVILHNKQRKHHMKDKTHSSEQLLSYSMNLPVQKNNNQLSEHQKLKISHSQREVEIMPSLKTCESKLLDNDLRTKQMHIIDEDLQSSGGFQIQFQSDTQDIQPGTKFKIFDVSQTEKSLIEEIVKEAKNRKQQNPQKEISYKKETYPCFKCSQTINQQFKKSEKCELCRGKRSLGRNHPYIQLLSSIIDEKIENIFKT